MNKKTYFKLCILITTIFAHIVVMGVLLIEERVVTEGNTKEYYRRNGTLDRIEETDLTGLLKTSRIFDKYYNQVAEKMFYYDANGILLSTITIYFRKSDFDFSYDIFNRYPRITEEYLSEYTDGHLLYTGHEYYPTPQDWHSHVARNEYKKYYVHTTASTGELWRRFVLSNQWAEERNAEGALQRRWIFNAPFLHNGLAEEFEYNTNGSLSSRITYKDISHSSQSIDYTPNSAPTIDEFDYDSQGNLVNVRRVQN